jgi:L-proline amide hydrolase
MPDEVRIPLEHGESIGKRDSEEYLEALDKFYQAHLITIDMPDYVVASFSSMGEVYHTMQGESELALTGSLRDYDLTQKLPEISAPVLVTSGKYDQCTPLVVKTTLGGIKNSRAVLFEKSAHMAFVEERELFMKTAEAFLSEAERVQ